MPPQKGRCLTVNLHNISVIDLSSVVGMLVSFGGVSSLVSYLRVLFLDHVLSGLSGQQRDYTLRGLVFLLNIAAILGLSLVFFGQPMSTSLLVSVLFAAAGASGLGHMQYHLSVNTKASSGDPVYAEIPADAYPPLSPVPDPVPPTDAPQSAALDPAA